MGAMAENITKSWGTIEGFSPDDIEFLRVKVGNDIGYVTLRYRSRTFCAGCSIFGNPASSERYSGRGWKERMKADAEKYLLAVMQAGIY